MDNPGALVETALQYAGYGWRVIPVRTWGAVRGRGKAPWFKQWPTLATCDPDQIRQWWEKYPRANVGVLFGPASGLCEIEGDHPDSEKDLLTLFDGDVPVTVCFAGGRGKHWLFRWRDDLPSGAKVEIGHLEVRTGNDAKGAQSVFPPSIHYHEGVLSGKQYTWLVPPEAADLAELPQVVVTRLWNLAGETNLAPPTKGRKPKEHWQRIIAGLPEGERTGGIISYLGKMFRSIANLEDQETLEFIYQAISAVNSRNHPPHDEAKIRADFDSILKREKQRRLSDEVNATIGDSAAPIDQGLKLKPIKDWRIVIVDSDPPMYELYAPQFHAAENQCLNLTAEQCCSGPQIRVQALKQANCALPRSFATNWDKRQRDNSGTWQPSLFERLVRGAEHREAPPEEKRRVYIAQFVWTELEKAWTLDEGKKPSTAPTFKRDDGSVWFQFEALYETARHAYRGEITRQDLSRIVRRYGATEHTLTLDSGKRKRFMQFSAEGYTELTAAALVERARAYT
ncbi:MAG TPA: bifunctional DNA primase/polymerase [Thermoguttaceae bacterium]|nr:bifunctional DNA primase/polymerase [Thermoguttaceae bacterium]